MKHRIVSFVVAVLCIISGCSVHAKTSVAEVGEGQESLDNDSYGVVIGQNICPDIFGEEYDYLLVFVYGQSYTVARDGGYCVTEELDDDLYTLSSVSNGGNLIRVKDTYAAQNENIANTAVDIIIKLIRQYSNKSPRFIIGNEGRGSRTVLELMKESSIKTLLSSEEWDVFRGLNTYENRYSRVADYLNNLKRWAAKNNKKILCPFFVYLQGESDTHRGVASHGQISSSGGDYAIYKERLSVILSDLKKDIVDATGQKIAPVAFIDNVGNGQFHDILSGISQAQTDVTFNLDGVYSCGPYYAYPSYGAHPTPDGRRWIGEAIAKLFYSVFMEGTIRPMCIAGYTIEGSEIILDVKTPHPPLVWDSYTSKEQRNSGFKAFDSSLHELKIKSVTVRKSQIVLSLESLPQSDIYVSYGSDGYGNIRDSDNWESFYKYESNDLGDKFELKHFPSDQFGNELIGKQYPMWNWLPFGFVKIIR